MRPPICWVCGKTDERKPDAPRGDWVQFADYRPVPDGMVGHPHGLEWFCHKHLAKAQALAGEATDVANKKLGVR